MARAIHLEEFLWRGRPAGSDQATAWHIRLMATGGTDDFGRPVPAANSDPLTPEQAAEQGFPLPKVLETINADALGEVESLRKAKADLEQSLAAEQEKSASLERILEAERAANAEQVETLRAQIAELKRARDAAAVSSTDVV
ncbi:hypothetical protein [Methylobacterium radiotolerans]|uniref:hypothetical protein n=1 Tax=Methylobacterium radiotolerans TaxID=31998 RepID=UPI0015F4261D|nr:hypothetical protein [Methylobacterium radiotolerans]